MKRILTAILASCMTLSMLASCGGSSEPSSSTGNSAPVTAGSSDNSGNAGGETDPYAEKITITAAGPNFDGVDPETNEFWKAICERFNIQIDLVELTYDGWNEKIRTWISSGDMPDVVQWDFLYSDYLNFAKSGVLRPVPDLSNYPNMQALKDSMDICKAIEIDGEMWAWPRKLIVNPYNNVDQNQYLYRKDWAEAVGMGDVAAKGILTMDEFEALMKAFKEQDPGNLGDKNIVMDSSFCFPLLSGMNFYSPNYNRYVEKDGKYVWGAALPETIEGLKYMKDLYEKGYIYKDFYSSKGYDAKARFLSGMVGIYADCPNLGHYTEYRTEFNKANDLDAYEVIGAFVVTGPDGKVNTQQISEYWSASLYSAKMSDEELDRVMQMADWLAGPEGSNWAFYGIKGKDWDEKADGSIEIKWPKDENGNYQPLDYGNAIWIRQFALAGGDQDFVNPSVPPQDLEDWKTFAENKGSVANIIPINYALDFLDTPQKSKFGSFQQDIADEITKLIVSSKDIEADWTAWVESMMPKVNPILDEINSAMK